MGSTAAFIDVVRVVMRASVVAVSFIFLNKFNFKIYFGLIWSEMNKFKINLKWRI